MPNTDLHGWETPDGSEQPQVHLDIEKLADAIDADVPVVSTSAPPHKNGRLWYNPTTKCYSVSDGTGWKQKPYAEYFISVVCDAFGTISGTMPAGLFSQIPSCIATVQSGSQFAFASVQALTTTTFAGKCGYFPSGTGGVAQTPGFTVHVWLVQQVA